MRRYRGTCDLVFDDVEDALGGLDVLISNVGIAGPAGPVPRAAARRLRERTIAVNLNSQFYFAQRAVPLLKQSTLGPSLVVTMSSVAGRLRLHIPHALRGHQWAIVGLVKSLAIELGPHGVRVNAILPGTVEGERMNGVIGARCQRGRVGRRDARAVPAEDLAAADGHRRRRRRHGALPVLTGGAQRHRTSQSASTGTWNTSETPRDNDTFRQNHGDINAQTQHPRHAPPASPGRWASWSGTAAAAPVKIGVRETCPGRRPRPARPTVPLSATPSTRSTRRAAGTSRPQLLEYDNQGGPAGAADKLKAAAADGVHLIVQGASSAIGGQITEDVRKRNLRNPGKEMIYINVGAEALERPARSAASTTPASAATPRSAPRRW